MQPRPWKCAVELEDLAESLEAQGLPEAERLRAFARQIRTDGCHIASPCEGCSGGYKLQDLVPENAGEGNGAAVPARRDDDDGPETAPCDQACRCSAPGAARRVA
ncbi:MAG: hypothetical protein GVY13_12055 [Alphaproteobacteria bacterium]|jgi:hypothetical protein|nr:hypothetical protein [Alphaproteobacteria bacterium]